MRLIDANAIKIKPVYMHDICGVVMIRVEDIARILNDMPTISPAPERKTGKWIYGEHDVTMCDGYRCSNCGFFVPWDYQHKAIDFINDYWFCPSCGAKMEGEQDE